MHHRDTEHKARELSWNQSTVSSFFQNSVAAYPNVTLANFPVIAAGERYLSNASTITFSPLLFSQKGLATWEAFAAEESMVTSTVLDLIQPPADWFKYDRTMDDGIYSFGNNGQPIDFEGSGPYAPFWHISPRPNNTASLMYNQMGGEARRSALENLIEGGGAVFSRVIYDEEDHHPMHVRGDETPRGIVYAPVNDFTTGKLAGVVGVEFVWEDYFHSAFLGESMGLVIVLEATNGQVRLFLNSECCDGSCSHAMLFP